MWVSRRKGEGERKKIVRPPQLCTTKGRKRRRKEEERKEGRGKRKEGKPRTALE